MKSKNGSAAALLDVATAKPATIQPMPPSKKPAESAKPRVTAETLATQQREISVAEFFTKNRHLLGFDNPRKALLTTVKEAVDNALDACEEAAILPSVRVKIEVAPSRDGSKPTPAQADRFIVTVTDNGPGIVKEQVGRIFAKLLYGSKFHRLRQSRGQQGIGISAAGMYGQLTTGKPVRVVSRTSPSKPAHAFVIQIDTRKNEPHLLGKPEEIREWPFAQGTQVAIELEGKYQKGRASVDEYMELTSIANPHAELVYEPPEGGEIRYPRGVAELPRAPREIKPHPYGIELGLLLKMLQDTKSHWLSGFLSSEFSRVSARGADEICKAAKLDARARPRSVTGHDAEKLYGAIQGAKLMAPPTDCLSPIGEDAILAGLYKQIRGEFYTAVTRPPAVYRGNPFVIEAGLAYGSDPKTAKKAAEAGSDAPLAEGESSRGDVELARVIRFANRVPLLYQQSACATYQSVLELDWKNYGLSQSRGALPQGPFVIFVHMASVWVPFTSESKEAIADYDQIRKEIKLALQEAGRRLGGYIRKREHAQTEWKRRSVFGLYIEEVAEACGRLKKGKLDVERLKKQLQRIAEEKTGGEETDRMLRKQREEEERREHTIVVTPEGAEGAVPRMLEGAPVVAAAAAEDGGVVPSTPELIPGSTARAPKSARAAGPPKPTKSAAKRKKAKASAKPAATRPKPPAGAPPKASEPSLFDDVVAPIESPLKKKPR